MNCTGRPRCCAAAAVTTWSAIPPCAFPPNPPPTCGAITRTASSGICNERASWTRAPCGTWVDSHTARLPSPSGTASAAWPSIGATARRGIRSSVRTTISEPSNPGGSPSDGHSSATFDPCSGKSTGAPGATAAATSRTTGNWSSSTTTSSAASSAAASDSATTATTRSPTYRTTSTASGGWARASGISWISQIGSIGRSAAVNTPRTPGAAAAGAVSIAVMRSVRDRGTDEHQVQPVRDIDVGDEAGSTRQERVVAAGPTRGSRHRHGSIAVM